MLKKRIPFFHLRLSVLKLFSGLFFLFFCYSSFIFSEVQYSVEYQGIKNKSVLAFFKTVSNLESLKDNPPETVTALKRRIEGDIPRFLDVLHSKAYYNASVEYSIVEEEKTSEVSIIIKINPGPIYKFIEYRVFFSGKEDPLLDQILEKHLNPLPLQLDQPALADKIIEVERDLLSLLSKNSYALASLKKRKVLVDQTQDGVLLHLYIKTGPRVKFGETKIVGLKGIEEEFVRRRIKWKEGKWLQIKKIEKTQELLQATSLFSSVQITYEKKAKEDGAVPLTILVSEKKHRSIGLGLSYNTQLGSGLGLEWEHRNIRNKGEKLRFTSDFSSQQQLVKLSYRKPDFKRLQQDFIWLTEWKKLSLKSFDDSSVSLSGILERKINDQTYYSYGGKFEKIEPSQEDKEEKFTLFKVPADFHWKHVNSLISPSSGFAFDAEVIPSMQLLNKNIYYIFNRFTFSVYHPLTDDHKLVMAAKATFGSILGSSKSRIPASERLYSGSENTLRGYSYLSVSPLSDAGKPAGGRSLMVYTLEPRYKLTEKVEVIAFYETGNVYSSPFPLMAGKHLSSWGVGLRYHTPIGPIRFDVGVPINRREGLDKGYQIYFSLGQAF